MMKLLSRKNRKHIVEEEQEVQVHHDIGQMLRECMEFGKPMLMCHDDQKWTANVELNTCSIIEGKVRSGHDHKTPESALINLLEKLTTLGEEQK